MDGDSTISSLTLGRGRAEAPDEATPRPQLIVAATCDAPLAPASRHSLADVDVVWFGRGEPRVVRDRDGGLRRLSIWLPDRRMSSQHGQLRRTGDRWLLDDPTSKNGCVVNAALTRRAAVVDGDVIELGHTFFLFREAPLPPTAPADARADELAPALPALATFSVPLATRFSALARIAPTDVSVVILGETGTGKEVVARALHALSGRTGEFVAVNCGALPDTLLEAELFGHRRGAFSGAVADRPGLIRSADHGTLFLDEIADLPNASQTAFLRVLQEQEVVPVGDERPVKIDVRLCAATHRDLDAMVDTGSFRRDLYARLFGLVVELPPLRRRKEDLGLLIAALLRRSALGERARFAPAALRALFLYDWPLNVRELEKCLVAATALADSGVIEAQHLPPAVQRALRSDFARAGATAIDPGTAPTQPAMAATDPRPDALTESDVALRERLVQLLVTHEGNVAAVARELRKGRMQIHRWAHRLGIRLDAYRPRP